MTPISWSKTRLLPGYFEDLLAACPDLAPKMAANWILGDLFGLMNQDGKRISEHEVTPKRMGELLELVKAGKAQQHHSESCLSRNVFHREGSYQHYYRAWF